MQVNPEKAQRNPSPGPLGLEPRVKLVSSPVLARLVEQAERMATEEDMARQVPGRPSTGQPQPARLTVQYSYD